MSAEDEKQPLESIPLSEAEIVPTVRAITGALVYCFERFGESAKKDVADTLDFKASDRGLGKHLERHPGANADFVRQAFQEITAELK